MITKHPGTGGLVTVDTVTAQLLYEISGPRYLGPDVTARSTRIRARPRTAPTGCAITGVRGRAAAATLKVCVNELGGSATRSSFVLTGLDIEAKAAWSRGPARGRAARRARPSWRGRRPAPTAPDADTEEARQRLLRCAVQDPDPTGRAGRSRGAAVELALASTPASRSPRRPGTGSPYGVYTAGVRRPQADVPHVPSCPTAARVGIDPPAARRPDERVVRGSPRPGRQSRLSRGPTRRLPLGTFVHARSGDKGGDAEPRAVGRARDDAGRARGWLRTLTADRRSASCCPRPPT